MKVQIKALPKLNPTSRRAVYAALIGIAAVALYNWIVAPHLTYLRAVQHYGPIVDLISRQRVVLKDQMARRRTDLDGLETQFDQIRPLLYTQDQARQLLGDLEAMAAQHHCAITAVDLASDRPTPIVGSEQDPLQIQEIQTSLTVVGDYDGIMALLGQLQALPRKIWIRSLTMELTGPDTTRHQCRMDIGLYVIQEKEIPSHD